MISSKNALPINQVSFLSLISTASVDSLNIALESIQHIQLEPNKKEKIQNHILQIMKEVKKNKEQINLEKIEESKEAIKIMFNPIT